MAFTADQLLLLNTLSYLSIDNVYKPQEGMTVAEFIAPILASEDTLASLAGDAQTAGDIVHTLNRIRNDPSLMEMEFSHVSQSEGGANRFVLTTPEGAGAREAVVVLEGTTGGGEWRDDALGGAATDQADGVSTEVQVKTQEWYRSDEVQQILNDCDHVTVTGHSKGGNEAKYLTVLNDDIDACVSFDGQGFSDEFMNRYRDQIARRQDIIDNYSNADDFVNVLLNDIGRRHYIQGTPQEQFYYAHSLFTLVHAEPLSSMETEQNPVMDEFGKILTGYLRTLNPKDRALFAKMLGELLADLAGGDPFNGAQYLKWLYLDGGMELVNRFLAYAAGSAVLRIIMEALKAILGEDNPLIKTLEKWLEPWYDSRSDMTVPSVGAHAEADVIAVDSEALARLAKQLNALAAELSGLCGSISACAADCDGFHILFQLSVSLRLRLAGAVSGLCVGTPGHVLRSTGRDMAKLRAEVERLAGSVAQAAGSFEELEQRNISKIPAGAGMRSEFA